MTVHAKQKVEGANYFVIIPRLAKKELTGNEYLLLSHYIEFTSGCWEATKTTASNTGLSVGTVVKCRRSLAEKGWLNITEPKNNHDTIKISVNYKWQENERFHKEKYGDSSTRSESEHPVQDLESTRSDFEIPPVQILEPNKNKHINKNKDEKEPAFTSAQIDDLFRNPRKEKRRKKGFQAGSLYVPPKGKEGLYEYVKDKFPEGGREMRFQQISDLDYVTKSMLDDWLTAQKKSKPYETHYLGSAYNYFLQNPPTAVTTTQYHQPDADGGW